MSYKFTKEQIQKEILKCGRDPVYFINTYARVSHPIRGPIAFKTYPFQDEALKNFIDHRFNVVLKARQLGLSTIVAAYVAWMLLFHRDKNVLVLATKILSASNLVKKVKYVIKNLPPWLMIASIAIDNRHSFELSNGSLIKASATSGDAGRSEALSLLVLDEAAIIEGMEELWAGVYPTLATGGRCIAISTPYGVGNWFHQTYIGAEAGTNDFFPMKLHWSVHPDRDAEWFEKETRNMERRKIAQEYECSFNASGETVIAPEDIEYYHNNTAEPKHRTGVDRNYWIWKEYNPNHSYALIADVARGDGSDFSVFHMLDVDTMEVVGEYQGKMPTDEYARFLDACGREYGNCMIVIENNNIGYAVLKELINIGYPNVFHSVKGTNEYIDQALAESMSNSVPGFTTSYKSRPLIIAKLEEFIRNKALKINSKRVMNELNTFIWHNGKPQAMRGYNDDLVMSLAIACWIKDTIFQTSYREAEYKKAMIGGILKSNTVLNTSIHGMNKFNNNDFNMKENMAVYNEFNWIFKG
jgi:hypothetical protein